MGYSHYAIWRFGSKWAYSPWASISNSYRYQVDKRTFMKDNTGYLKFGLTLAVF